MAFLPPEYCRLFAQKKAYQGGSQAPQDPPPSYTPGLKKYYLDWLYPEVIIKFSRMDRLPNFLSDSAPLARKELRYKPWIILTQVWTAQPWLL